MIISLLWILLYSFYLNSELTYLAPKRTRFYIKQKPSKFLLEIMTLVSWANNIRSDTEFILRGRSFTYIMNNIGSRTDPWGNSCFILPQSEKKFLSFIRWFSLKFLFPESWIEFELICRYSHGYTVHQWYQTFYSPTNAHVEFIKTN